MVSMVYLAGYLISIVATAGIVAGIEMLNQYCSYGPGRQAKPVAITVTSRQARLRQDRP